MFVKKLIIGLLMVCLLNGCVQSTALLGPAITIGTTGNIVEAGLQLGTNHAIKQETGKDAFTHISDAVEEDKRKKNFNKNFVRLLESRIKKTREKLNLTNQ